MLKWFSKSSTSSVFSFLLRKHYPETRTSTHSNTHQHWSVHLSDDQVIAIHMITCKYDEKSYLSINTKAWGLATKTTSKDRTNVQFEFQGTSQVRFICFPLELVLKKVFQSIKQKYIFLLIYSSLLFIIFSLQKAHTFIPQNKYWLWTKTKKKERISKECAMVLCEY